MTDFGQGLLGLGIGLGLKALLGKLILYYPITGWGYKAKELSSYFLSFATFLIPIIRLGRSSEWRKEAKGKTELRTSGRTSRKKVDKESEVEEAELWKEEPLFKETLWIYDIFLQIKVFGFDKDCPWIHIWNQVIFVGQNSIETLVVAVSHCQWPNHKWCHPSFKHLWDQIYDKHIHVIRF